MATTTPTPDAAQAKPSDDGSQAAPAARGLMSKGKLKLGVGLTLLAMMLGGLLWWMVRPAKKTPADQVLQALKFLDQGKFVPAREIAKRLADKNYRHPGFTGVLEYIQGMAAFGLAEASGDSQDRSQYALVIPFLQQAERLSIDDERRPAWSYALGKSLYMVQDSATSRPLLEESLKTYPQGAIDAAEMLVDLYLDPGIQTPELLKQAIELNQPIIEIEEKPQTKQERIIRQIAWLQRAEIYLALRQFDQAKESMNRLALLVKEWGEIEAPDRTSESNDISKSAIFQMLHARIWMAQAQDSRTPDECYFQAIKVLKPFVETRRSGQDQLSEAFYLMGLANERLSEIESETPEIKEQAHSDTKTYFELAAERYSGTPEAIAANLHLGHWWRLNSYPEKALQSYGTALRSIRHMDKYRNRWISLNQFRQMILEAWNSWLDNHLFFEAIALSELMTPIFPREEAYEFVARSHQRWAEDMEEDLSQKKFADRVLKTEELRRRWRQSADAYVRLAEARISSAKYPEALWNAAEQYRKGHDFELALEMINKFLATEPDRLMAAALVLRSRIELDLDQIPQALADLQQVIQKYPTDPSIFTAMYLIGVCHYEQNELDKAEAIWRGILFSDQLLPSAVEWRDAQLSLGRLLYEKGELERRQVLVQSTPLEPTATQEIYNQASSNWQQASLMLARYLDRNSTGAGVREARYYLAKSLQREAEWLGLQRQHAETDNARMQLQKVQDMTLEKSYRHFEALRNDLLDGDSKGRLDELEQRLLKNCFFEIPHTLFQLQRFNDAIAAYNSAVSRFPNDVQTLVAYLQMAQCYESMSPPMPVEARSMLQQAKVILSHKQIPDAAFQSPSTNFSRTEWQDWLERASLVQ